MVRAVVFVIAEQDGCDLILCQNNGQCYSGDDPFNDVMCDCYDTGYTGEFCQHRV